MSWGLENRLVPHHPAGGRPHRHARRRPRLLPRPDDAGSRTRATRSCRSRPYADTLMLTRGVLRTSIAEHAGHARSCCASRAATACSTTTSPTRRSSPTSRSASGSTPPAWRSRSSSARRISTRRSRTSRKLIDEGERYGIPVHRRHRRGQGHGPRRALPRAGVAASPPRWARTSSRRTTATTSSASPARARVPVVMAGGKKLPEREALEMTCERHRARRRRRGHGPQHLPVRLARRHDQGRARDRARRRLGRRRLRRLHGREGARAAPPAAPARARRRPRKI